MTVGRSQSTYWLALFGAIVLILLSMGMRQGFAVFLTPVTEALQIGRESFGLAMALQNLAFGLCSPVIGALSDKFGAFRVVVCCALAQWLGMTLAGMADGAMSLHLGMGLLVGVGQAGTTYTIVLGVLGRMLPVEKRSAVFGWVTAAGSFGMFAMVPVSQGAIELFDWSHAYLILGALVGVGCMLCALGLRGDRVNHAHEQSMSQAWRQARSHSGYVLLNLGFFVCGFHVTFVGVHLAAFLQDQGLTAEVAVSALASIGLFNIVGSVFFGWMGGRYRKKHVLMGLYLARAVLFAGFLALPVTNLSAVIFAAVIGFLWLGTVPLTSGIVGDVFGVRYLSTLYGVVFLSHQLGSFAGAWLGGWVYDQTGQYDPVWYLSIVLGVVAAGLHWMINDRPVTAVKLNVPAA